MTDKVITELNLIDIWLSDEPGHPGGTPPTVVTSWWWLSFADAELPEGEQFLGGLFLRGASLLGVIAASHERGLNPGGEVEATQLPAEVDVPARWAERLLSREEIEEMDREMGAR